MYSQNSKHDGKWLRYAVCSRYICSVYRPISFLDPCALVGQLPQESSIKIWHNTGRSTLFIWLSSHIRYTGIPSHPYLEDDLYRLSPSRYTITNFTDPGVVVRIPWCVIPFLLFSWLPMLTARMDRTIPVWDNAQVSDKPLCWYTSSALLHRRESSWRYVPCIVIPFLVLSSFF